MAMKDSIEAPSDMDSRDQPSPWLLRAAAGVRHLLQTARDTGALHKALYPQSCADPEYTDLVLAGQMALKRVSHDHASQEAGSFFDDVELANLANACCSVAALSNAFELLDYWDFFQNGSTLDSLQPADLLAAALGELQTSSLELKSAGSKAKRGLMDFLCMIGTGDLQGSQK